MINCNTNTTNGNPRFAPKISVRMEKCDVATLFVVLVEPGRNSFLWLGKNSRKYSAVMNRLLVLGGLARSGEEKCPLQPLLDIGPG